MRNLFKPLLASFLLLGAARSGAAQNAEFTKEDLPDRENLKLALREIKLGDAEAEADPARYAAALPHYLRASAVNPSNAALNLKIGEAYLHSDTKPAALAYLQKAQQLHPEASARLSYLLGRALHLNAKWSEAIAEYQRARPLADDRAGETVTAADLARRIQECRNGIELQARPARVFIDNAGPAINSAGPDYGPLVSADESVLLLTSRRPGSTGGQRERNSEGFFEDIYLAQISADNQWIPARNLGAPVNTGGHDATVGIAPDGQRMLVYVEENGGDLNEANLEGAAWSKPRRLGSRINTKYHESSACYTPDGRSLYFVSDKPEGGRGGRDIYRITIEGTDKARNLGPVINTPYGEEGVFLMPDGKTMYFSSEGHNSMGGYDIFKTTLGDNGQWSAPENLGWPINTPDDDVFLVTSASGRHGYYSSDRAGGLGSKDIYRITFLGPEKQPAFSQEEPLLAGRAQPIKETQLAPAVAVTTAKVTILKGVVTDALSKQPVAATIDVIDNLRGESIATFQANGVSGRYLVSLPSGINYGIVVRQDGYLFHSENFDLPAAATYAEVVKDVQLKKLEVGTTIVLRNIFFDTGKATLRPESTAELSRLLKLLEEQPALKLEMAGHTDNVGTAATNRDLSQRRAQAVVAYLVGKGVSGERLTAAGYGDTKPVLPNTNKVNRQLNRRTEFKVVAK
ncbi:OmpA family protein [uncultured Hymenobacter sp.]|uniref:OmpA family protein n=1 Tax=uncultured Hymenobacter sp. TaxID=170016 RepID=UPI0035CAF201